MIKLSNDFKFTFACGSGALAFNGNGWLWEQPYRWLGLLDPTKFVVVAKTITIMPIEGNLKLYKPWTCVRLCDNNSVVNAVGLTNPGIDKWITKYHSTISKYDFALSIKVDNENEAYMFADIINHEINNAKYVEVNISCPNIKNNYVKIKDILYILWASLHLPIVLKLSWSQINESFINVAIPYVEAFHCINTVPWDTIYPNETSPIEHYKHKQKGGVSGKAIKLYTYNAIKKLRRLTVKPIISGGGIFDVQDVLDFEEVGAGAFSIGTCFLYYPWKPNQIIKEYNQGRNNERQ